VASPWWGASTPNACLGGEFRADIVMHPNPAGFTRWRATPLPRHIGRNRAGSTSLKDWLPYHL